MSVSNDTSVNAAMNLGGAMIGVVLGGLVCGFGIGVPLALTTGFEPLGCIFGGVFGGGACGAFLGGTAPFVVAKVREHQDKKNLTPNDPGILNSDL